MDRFWDYLIILGITIFTLYVGDANLKRAGSGNNLINWRYFLIGLLVYIITAFLWFVVYRGVKFSIIGSVYGVCTALVSAIIGVFVFKESLTAIEAIGIIMAIASILILGRFN